MSYIKISDFEDAFNDYLNLLKNQDDSIIERTKNQYEGLKKEFKSPKVSYCIREFIKAELDFVKPGKKGIGRKGTKPPRFGAYFRKSMSEMTTEDIEKLHLIMQEFILRGYLLNVLFMEEEIKKPTNISKEKLFKSWVPSIYVADTKELGKVLYNVLLGIIDKPYKQLEAFKLKHKMKAKGIFLGDKTFKIVERYAVGGVGLRSFETSLEDS